MYVAQQGASQIICQVLSGRNLNQVLTAYLQKNPGLTPQRRGMLQDLSYGALRFYGQLRRVLDQLLHHPLQDDRVRCLLLVALYQLEYGKSAPYAVVDHAVRAALNINSRTGGLVNAVLRNFLRKRDMLLEVAAQKEEGRYSYPQWWIDAVKQQYGAEAEAILISGNHRPPMTLRVNRRRTTPDDYVALLAQHDIQASTIAPDGVVLVHPVPVEKLPGFLEGLASVQDAGAQYAAHLLDVHDGMRVLDACAAPGGKSVHLLELAQIDLVALDKDEARLERVRENLQRLQFDAHVLRSDAAQPNLWWDGRPFQRILADVPCSATGVVRRHPDIKWLRRASDIDSFAQQQLQILGALWRLLERDGKLLYTTCSIFAQENQQVINSFLQQQADARLLPLPAFGADAVNSSGALRHAREGQLLPDDQHDGFFYALLQKTDDRSQKTEQHE